jgi:hypothetical protein
MLEAQKKKPAAGAKERVHDGGIQCVHLVTKHPIKRLFLLWLLDAYYRKFFSDDFHCASKQYPRAQRMKAQNMHRGHSSSLDIRQRSIIFVVDSIVALRSARLFYFGNRDRWARRKKGK